MSYQGALDFIKAGRELGLSDHDIAQRLRGAGWRSDDVQDAFALMASMGRIPQPVARLASTPMVAQQPVVHAEPQPVHAQPEPQPVTEKNPDSRAATAKKKRSTSMRWVGWIALVIAAFVLGYFIM